MTGPLKLSAVVSLLRSLWTNCAGGYTVFIEGNVSADSGRPDTRPAVCTRVRLGLLGRWHHLGHNVNNLADICARHGTEQDGWPVMELVFLDSQGASLLF